VEVIVGHECAPPRGEGALNRSTDESANNFTLLRLLLALMVVFGHFKLLSGTAFPLFPFNLADAAVDCFFVVSGFLIAGSYERSHGLWSFYARRVFRLYPMYVCVVLIQTAIMLALLPNGPFSEPESTLRYLVANLLFANFLQYDIGGVLAGLHNPGINPSLWTLKIEIGFYLIVPLIFTAAQRWGRWVLALIFLASVGYSVYTLRLGDVQLARQLPGQLQFFVVGMALYLYGARIRVPTPASLAIAVAFFVAWTYLSPIPPGIRPLDVAAFVFSFALYTPVIRMKRDISYSVYLLHGPLLQTLLLLGIFRDSLPFLVGVVAAVLLSACITERLVERPGNAFGYHLARRLDHRAPRIPSVA
jgi:peptidoglycan/LPS O-acetylase OafA/YrhL